MARSPIHPGEHISETIEALNISARELGCVLAIPLNRISEIIRGRRGISADTALRLGCWLGTGLDVWLNLQKTYELRTAEELHGREIERQVTPPVSENRDQTYYERATEDTSLASLPNCLLVISTEGRNLFASLVTGETRDFSLPEFSSK